MTDNKYPEHAKLQAVREKSQACGEFLDWLENEQHYVIAQYVGDKLMPAKTRTMKLLAEFFEIDEEKIEMEKRAMLEELRNLNQSTP